MAYVKTQWVNGDTITADKLNHIEGGIEANDAANSDLKSHLEATQIVNEASGAIATFPDGSDGVPMRSVTVEMEPIQNLNGQDAPYPAGGGKNLNPNEGVNISIGTAIRIYCEAGDYVFSTNNGNNILGGETFYLSVFDSETSENNITDGAITSAYMTLNGSKTLYYSTIGRNNIPFTVNTAGWVACGFNNQTPTNYTAFQIEKGSTATAYAPYSNICPISGRSTVDVTRSGKNMLDSSFCTDRTQNGIMTVRNSDGSITYSGTASSGSRYWNSADTLGLTLAAGTYTLSPSNLKLEGTGVTKTGTFTLDAETTFNNVILVVTNGTTYSATTIYPQLEVGSTATVYQAYTAETITIPLGQTVYGGTVDAVSGVMTVDRAMVDLGSLTWEAGTDSIGTYFSGSISKGVVSLTENICTIYKTVLSTNVLNNCIAMANSGWVVYVRDNRYETATDFTTGVNGQLFVYKLATPVTVQLTAQQLTTLLGTNNVWSDGGNVDVDYVADTKLYIDAKIAALA